MPTGCKQTYRRCHPESIPGVTVWQASRCSWLTKAKDALQAVVESERLADLGG